MRRGAVAAAMFLATTFAVGLPAQLRAIVTTPERGVVFGQPFELTFERAWPLDHDPQPLDAAVLAPLELREIAVSMRASGTELIERRRFEAVVFEVGDIVFAPYALRTRDPSGREHVAEFAIDALTVRSSLPQPPGGVEWPGDVRDAGSVPVWPLVVGVLALIVLVSFGLQRLRRPAQAATVVSVGPTAVELARQEIAALGLPGRAPGLRDRARLEAYYLALAEIVRRFAMRRFGVRASVHTSEELIAVVPLGSEPLQQCLFACDLVKFAATRPDAAGDVEARTRALAFIEANAGNAELEVAS